MLHPQAKIKISIDFEIVLNIHIHEMVVRIFLLKQNLEKQNSL